MGALDGALIERILAVLAPKKLAPHKRLVPLLSVNKHWHLLARRRLYAAIALKGPWVARPLRRTLESNQELAALVRELVLDTELSAQDAGETADHARIVAACPHLQHLTILGYATAELEAYRTAIASRAELISLNVSEGAGMFTFPQLLAMMSRWPSLEKLILKGVLLPCEGLTAEPPAGPTCAQLKMVKIIDRLDAGQHFTFAAFATLAPALSVLWVQPQHAMPPDLPAALRRWAPTLEALCLLSDAASDPPLDAVLPILPALKHLDTTAALLDPRAVARAPAPLTALTYRVPSVQLPDLAAALARPGALPALKALDVKSALDVKGAPPPAPFPPAATQTLRAVCKRRRIRLTL